MACNNCYNGCVETTSDKCVRYTGENVEALSIANGDNLYTVEQALINAVVSFLDGTGIDITIDPAAYCALVTSYLPECKPICASPTAVELFEALVKAACDLQEQIVDVAADIATLNADYDVDCLSGVTNSSDTHAVLQAAITKICELGVDLDALALDVDTNYVKIADINSYIAAYLAGISVSNKYYTKMVPYTVVEYYGALSGYPTGADGFSAAGVGYGYWENIYLCNGLNGTPDKRGRVSVGAIVGVGGGALNPAVDPSNPSNPNYALYTISGSNSVVLTSSQIPSHTHSATVTDPQHFHYLLGNDTVTATCAALSSTSILASNGDCGTNPNYQLSASAQVAATLAKSSSSTTGISVTNGNTGGGLGHSNIQPSIGCYYIMYKP
jgi:microcystin-dependent protein